jgi:predicted nuclease with TOPRIM domain
MGIFRRSSDELSELRSQLDDLRAQLTEERIARAALADQFERRLGVPKLPPPVPRTSLSEALADLQALSQRVEGLDGRTAAIHTEVRLRLDEVATQLTNQLSELTGELERTQADLYHQLAEQGAHVEEMAATALQVAAATPGTADDEALAEHLAELRANQIRIANDLARHEIALRADLATLASLVQGTRGRAIAELAPRTSES